MNKPKYLFFKILLMIILILPNVVFSDSFLLNNSCFKLKIPNHYYHENKDNQISWIGFGNENKEEFYFENYVIKYFKEKDDQLTLDSRLTFEHCYNCSMMDSGKIESRDIFIYNTNSELNISKMNEEIEESRRIGMKSHMITQKESKLFRNDFYSLRLFKDEKYFDIILDFWALKKDYIYDKESKTIFLWVSDIFGIKSYARKSKGLNSIALDTYNLNLLNYKVYNTIVIPKFTKGRFSISYIPMLLVVRNMKAVNFLDKIDHSDKAIEFFSSFKEIKCEELDK